MKFRKLTESDCQVYKEFRLEAFKESPMAFSECHEDEHHQPIEFFKTCMGTSDEHFSIGCFYDASELVAVATFKRDQRSKARHKSYIHTMYVAPEARGRKIADKILRELIDEARASLGLEQIHLWVLNPETSLARKLYLKHGFLPQGAVVKKDLKINGIYVDAEYMVLTLLGSNPTILKSSFNLR